MDQVAVIRTAHQAKRPAVQHLTPEDYGLSIIDRYPIRYAKICIDLNQGHLTLRPSKSEKIRPARKRGIQFNL